MFVKKQAAIETIIGASSIVRGELKSEATIRIDGMFEGRVRADCIVVGEAGTILGNIVCRAISIGGKIEGTIHARELADIKASGEVTGDIYAARLAVSEGGVLEGHSYMRKGQELERGSVLPFTAER